MWKQGDVMMMHDDAHFAGFGIAFGCLWVCGAFIRYDIHMANWSFQQVTQLFSKASSMAAL